MKMCRLFEIILLLYITTIGSGHEANPYGQDFLDHDHHNDHDQQPIIEQPQEIHQEQVPQQPQQTLHEQVNQQPEEVYIEPGVEHQPEVIHHEPEGQQIVQQQETIHQDPGIQQVHHQPEIPQQQQQYEVNHNQNMETPHEPDQLIVQPIVDPGVPIPLLLNKETDKTLFNNIYGKSWDNHWRDHLLQQPHLAPLVEGMRGSEELFHYFMSLDKDDDKELDGLELMQTIIEEGNQHGNADNIKIFTDQELQNKIDNILQDYDTDYNGKLSYSEVMRTFQSA